MNDDYYKFCMKCPWNDPELGCTSPPYEDDFQCELYRFYHPEEVKEFEEYCDRSRKNNG